MSLTTKRALATSLKTMLEKKTLDKITVKEIVNECKLNRQTFYYHFHDTYDLLEWMYMDETKDIIDKIYDPDAVLEKYELILKYILNNKNIILNTYYSLSQAYLENKLKEWIFPILYEIVKSHSDNATEEDMQFMADLYCYALIGLILDWVHHDLSEDFLPKLAKYGATFLLRIDLPVQ